LTYIAELKKSIDSWCRHARPGAGAADFLPWFHLRVAI
jgi:hypothetical protein